MLFKNWNFRLFVAQEDVVVVVVDVVDGDVPNGVSICRKNEPCLLLGSLHVVVVGGGGFGPKYFVGVLVSDVGVGFDVVIVPTFLFKDDRGRPFWFFPI